jgi:hypothetical protein
MDLRPKRLVVISHCFVSAPSTMRFVPEMRLASGLARNTTPGRDVFGNAHADDL